MSDIPASMAAQTTLLAEQDFERFGTIAIWTATDRPPPRWVGEAAERSIVTLAYFKVWLPLLGQSTLDQDRLLKQAVYRLNLRHSTRPYEVEVRLQLANAVPERYLRRLAAVHAVALNTPLQGKVREVVGGAFFRALFDPALPEVVLLDAA